MNGALPSGPPTVSPKPSASPVPTTPTPTAKPSATPVPTATPTASPAPTVTPTATPPPGTSACNTAPASLGVPYYAALVMQGNVPAGGGPLVLDPSASTWLKETLVSATPTPTPAPTVTPSPQPTVTPTPPPTRPFYVYSGTYHVSSLSAPTDGCFTAITTTDGSDISGSTYSADAIGAINPPDVANYGTSSVSLGSIAAVALTLSPSAQHDRHRHARRRRLGHDHGHVDADGAVARIAPAPAAAPPLDPRGVSER